MDQGLKDIFQVAAWLAATIGGLIAAFKAIVELRRNREQRQVELHWKKAHEAKKLLDELFDNNYSRNAMRMLDWSGRDYQIKNDFTEKITTEDVLIGLRVNDLKFSAKEAFIRDCFDQFFERLEYMQHLINIDLIEFKDISGPIEYYIELMGNNKKVFYDFLTFYDYSGTLSLFEKFDHWQNPT